MIQGYIYWTCRPEIFSIAPFHVSHGALLVCMLLCVIIGVADRLIFKKSAKKWESLPASQRTAESKPEYSWFAPLVCAAIFIVLARMQGAHPEGVMIGPLAVRWYGLMFLIGFTVGYYIMVKIFRHEGFPEEWVSTLLIWVAAGTIIGARLGHCFFYEWDYYSAHPAKIIAFWEGGLASHGGTIGVIIGVFCFSHYTSRRSALWTFDRLVVPVALVACLIRMGNLFNSEIFGCATTLPWGFMYPLSREWQVLYGPDQACHPTQLYEAGTYLLLFGLLNYMYWRRNAEARPGLLLGTFFIGCFLPRIIIEFVKNPQEAFEANMLLNMGQLLSVPFVLAGIILVWRALKRPKVELTFKEKNCK